ncbi:MAG TPA: ribose 5-phosphate isomerase A [Gemmatimonadales bacterium]|nr:ribose 5-phosphate isomerase A [Gemmatimonadales bacterium]
MSASQDEAKRRAAVEAVERAVRSGMRLGLGSGSTAAHVVRELARRIEAGDLRDLVGVPTSDATALLARGLGIPLATLDEEPALDVTIDGADEVDPGGNLIKGLGGALLREKMVASAARRFVVVVDESKLVARLGTKAPLPVEVIAFGARTHEAAIRAFGAEPVLRRGDDGTPYRTDEGNVILDCRFPSGIADPAEVARALKLRAGVAETGLFLGMTPDVIVGRR